MAGIGNIFWTALPVAPAVVPVTGANNGASVSGANIVLGNNTGAVLATLLSNREIPMGAFTITLTGANHKKITLGGFTSGGGSVSAGAIELNVNSTLDPAASAEFILNDEKSGGFGSLYMSLQDENFGWFLAGSRILEKDNNVHTDLLVGADAFLVGGFFQNGVQCGELGHRYAVLQFPGSAATNAVQQQSNSIFSTVSSAGGLATTIPAGLEIGTTFSFCNGDGQSCQVQVSGAEFIQFGAAASVAAGTISTTQKGAQVRLTCFATAVGAKFWIVEHFTGSWTIV